MKSSTKDKAEGKHEAKGKVKKESGESTRKPHLKAKGKSEKIAAKV